MDFGALLHAAKQNETNKKEVRTYSTKFAPPKKEDKKDKMLSANIQKFLAKKEAEEKRRAQEALKKRDELLALRSKDKRSTRRVNVMLKRTKSANQSVIEDAVDNDNTAVTLAGPAQPDEDDYGYVSQEASAFYTKMMEKYNKMPEEQKFPDTRKKASSNLNTTKDRVRAALEKEKLEAMMPHRRKRKHQEGGEQEHHDKDIEEADEVDTDSKSEPPPKAKPKFKAAPPMNFTELLKLASQKQHEPIMVEVKPKEEGPLFTKKQKREFEKEQQRREALERGKLSIEQIDEIRKLPPSHLYRTKKRETSRADVRDDDDDGDIEKTNNNIPKADRDYNTNKKDVLCDRVPKGIADNQVSNRIPKTVNLTGPNDSRLSKPVTDNRLPKGIPERLAGDSRLHEKVQNLNKTPKMQNGTHATKALNSKAVDNRLPKASTEKPLNDNHIPKGNDRMASDNRMSGPFKHPASSENRLKTSDTRLEPKPKLPSSLPQKQESGKFKVPSTSKYQVKQNDIPRKNDPNQVRALDKSKTSVGSRELNPKQVPPDDRRPKQFPPKDMKPKQFPPPDVRRKEFPPKNVRPPPVGTKRRIIDDDEEYDSEMDDFIDDGPEESNDYSTYIREIFGYDKRKYKVIEDEDDVDNMESSFAQQMREDIRSTKLGIMEDLEDIKREKEEKRRKALKKKGRL